MLIFKLEDSFVEKYSTIKPPFGFNGLGEVVYRRTYSRKNPDGTDEDWYQTVRRVVEGTYSLQNEHIESCQLGWNDIQGQQSAQEMYDKIFNMKFLPPGRGLWAMGTSIVHEKDLAAALNNCAFVSTEDIDKEEIKPFEFLMDASMLGVGVGFDCKGAGKLLIMGPYKEEDAIRYTIPDSREGWVKSLRMLLVSYFGVKGQKQVKVEFDYSLIRPKGQLLKTFGGLSSGPDPLIELHKNIQKRLDEEIGNLITSRVIVDICNFIGKCVVSGNIRRTAEIAFGEDFDEDFLDLKNYEKNPDRMEYGWTSNNSIFAKVGMDYTTVADHIQLNGEPGLCWLENMQNYGRMSDPANDKDKRVKGGNPCLEQSLESFEMCCLVETFPARHETLEEYLRTLKFAYLYAKTVTLRTTHWPETNRVMLRNRRIGCSMSGIAQFLAKNNLEILRQWLDSGYQTVQKWDEIYSNWFCIPRSIKTTSIKPSGTVSLLAGATPGMHFPESRFYIRRVRISKDSPLLIPLREANYHIEDCVNNPQTTAVVSFPVNVGENIKTVSEVSMFEQLNLAAFLQAHWADNQVSCTITFDSKTEGKQIPQALNFFQYQLKGVSFLPKLSYGAYPQMPYEEVTKETYGQMVSELSELSLVDRKAQRALAFTTPDTVVSSNVKAPKIPFNIKLKNTTESDSEEAVDLNIFPSAVSFCTNAGCI